MIQTFNKKNFTAYCDALAGKDKDLQKIIRQYGYPPLWKREASFETLMHIILEQQVSLASAKAALEKLRERIGIISPENLLALNDEEMRSCYFSRQKMVYARHLSEAILANRFSITGLKKLKDDDAITSMKTLKGIGDWTSDVFLMMALQRTDRFPVGDIALIKSIKKVKRLAADSSKEEILKVAARWQPYRTIAAYLLWHSYLSERSLNAVQKAQVSDTTKDE